MGTGVGGEGVRAGPGCCEKGLDHVEVFELELGDDDRRLIDARGCEGCAKGRARD